MGKKKESKTKEKTPIGRYFNIFYDVRISKTIKKRRFMIYFWGDFATDNEVMTKEIKTILDIETMNEIEEKDSEIGGSFEKYASGERNLSEGLLTACCRKEKKITDVKNRIRTFIKKHIPDRIDYVVNEIQNLFRELDLPDKTLYQLDQLSQDTKDKERTNYFQDTFQIVINAKYKQYESDSPNKNKSETAGTDTTVKYISQSHDAADDIDNNVVEEGSPQTATSLELNLPEKNLIDNRSDESSLREESESSLETNDSNTEISNKNKDDIGTEISLCHSRLGYYKVIGRDDEIDKLSEIYKSSNYAVLTGIGGLGKSRTALAYAYRFLQESSDGTVQIVMCGESDSLSEAVAKLRFNGLKDDDKDFDLRLKALQACKKRTLIILDNLRRFEQRDRADLRELTKSDNVLFLLTSRSTLVNDKQNVVRIEPLRDDLLLELYSYNRFNDIGGHKAYIDEHRELLMEMFERVGNHTLAVELLAKLPMRSGSTESEINERLKDGLNALPSALEFTKDGEEIQGAVNEIMKEIFSLSALNETEKDIMSHMSLIHLGGMRQKLFEKLTGYPSDEINGLKESSWIITDEESFRIRLHPIIAETVLNMDETKRSMKIREAFYIKLLSKETDGLLMDSLMEDENSVDTLDVILTQERILHINNPIFEIYRKKSEKERKEYEREKRRGRTYDLSYYEKLYDRKSITLEELLVEYNDEEREEKRKKYEEKEMEEEEERREQELWESGADNPDEFYEMEEEDTNLPPFEVLLFQEPYISEIRNLNEQLEKSDKGDRQAIVNDFYDNEPYISFFETLNELAELNKEDADRLFDTVYSQEPYASLYKKIKEMKNEEAE